MKREEQNVKALDLGDTYMNVFNVFNVLSLNYYLGTYLSRLSLKVLRVINPVNNQKNP